MQLDSVALSIDTYLPQHLGRGGVAERQRTARDTAAAVITSALGVGAGHAFLAGMQSKTPADLVLATGTCRSVALSRSVSQSVSQPVSQSPSLSVSQSVSQSAVHIPIAHAVHAPVTHAVLASARSDVRSVR